MAETRNRYPAVPEPTPDIPSMYEAIISVKQGYEILTGQRHLGLTGGSKVTRVVTFQDLIDMGLIVEDQVPRD